MKSSKLKCACCSIRGDKAIFFLRSDSISLIKQLNSIAIDQTISAGMPICNVYRKKANKVKLDESKIYQQFIFDLPFYRYLIYSFACLDNDNSLDNNIVDLNNNENEPIGKQLYA